MRGIMPVTPGKVDAILDCAQSIEQAFPKEDDSGDDIDEPQQSREEDEEYKYYFPPYFRWGGRTCHKFRLEGSVLKLSEKELRAAGKSTPSE